MRASHETKRGQIFPGSALEHVAARRAATIGLPASVPSALPVT
ncbi:MAG: hypothetical protein ACLGP3_09025 [Acidobacteriota bacterium]